MNEREILDGENAVYPGHPLTIAYLIINTYTSLAEAAKKSERTEFKDALSNGDIPGAGGNVYNALDFLDYVVNGRLSMKQAIGLANTMWANCDGQANGNIQRWKRGQEQADRILDRLTKQLEDWKYS